MQVSDPELSLQEKPSQLHCRTAMGKSHARKDGQEGNTISRMIHKAPASVGLCPGCSDSVLSQAAQQAPQAHSLQAVLLPPGYAG